MEYEREILKFGGNKTFVSKGLHFTDAGCDPKNAFMAFSLTGAYVIGGKTDQLEGATELDVSFDSIGITLLQDDIITNFNANSFCGHTFVKGEPFVLKKDSHGKQSTDDSGENYCEMVQFFDVGNWLYLAFKIDGNKLYLSDQDDEEEDTIKASTKDKRGTHWGDVMNRL